MNHIHTQQIVYKLHDHCNYSLFVSKGEHQMQWFAIGLTSKCHLFEHRLLSRLSSCSMFDTAWAASVTSLAFFASRFYISDTSRFCELESFSFDCSLLTFKASSNVTDQSVHTEAFFYWCWLPLHHQHSVWHHKLLFVWPVNLHGGSLPAFLHWHWKSETALNSSITMRHH